MEQRVESNNFLKHGAPSVYRTSPAFLVNRKSKSQTFKLRPRPRMFDNTEAFVEAQVQCKIEEKDKAVSALKALREVVPWEKMSEEQVLQTKQALVETEHYIDKLGKELEETQRAVKGASGQKLEKEKELQTLKQELNKPLPPWKSDKSRKECASCNRSFHLFNRRHHCRKCGELFDSRCASNFTPIADMGYKKPVRVCNFCIKQVRLDEKRRLSAAQAVAEKDKVAKQESEQRVHPLHRLLNDKTASKPPLPRASSFHAKLMEQVKVGSGKVKKTASFRTNRGTSENAENVPALGNKTSKESGVEEKPRTVLDELRRSLKKRNSCPQLLKKKTEAVDQIVEKTMSQKRRSLADQQLSCLQPKQGTAIASLLAKVQRENQENEEQNNDWEE